MAQNITLLGASYSNVPAVELPKTGGGTASFTDVTDTTAAASDVASGKYFFTANGVLTLGTNQGGSGDGYVWQDGSGYVHLSDEEGTQPIYDTLNVSSSGTFTPATGHAYNSVVVPSGSATPASSISGTSATVSTGTNTLTLTKTVSNTPQVSAGYISSGTSGNTSVSLTASVNTRSSSDLSVSGATVTAPSGYYASQATKTVASGTAGTPTATKGAVSDHSVSVTPSVTNTTGYITGSTKTGTAVTVTASELASGNKAITQNGTDIDVVGYSTVSVDVSGGATNVVMGTFTTQSTAGAQTINIPYTGSGYPLFVHLWVSEGAANADGAFYNTLRQYAVGAYYGDKNYPSSTPTYLGDSNENRWTGIVRYKSSTSTASLMSTNAATGTQGYSNSNALSTVQNILKVKSYKVLSVYVVTTTANSTYGLLADTDYTYVIGYSS